MPPIKKVIEALDFGKVDSESEPALEEKFLRTEDFDNFLRPEKVLVLGAKGSGKSALFEMFTRHETSARVLAGDSLKGVIIAGGTGFRDYKELTSTDIAEMRGEAGFNYDSLWELYILFKGAEATAKAGMASTGHLKDFYRTFGVSPDYRLLPILKGIYKWAVGKPPESLHLKCGGVEFKLDAREHFDTQDLLGELDALLTQTGRELWIIFDKIDELLSADHLERRKALEALFRVQMALAPKLRKVHLKILLRTDIWDTLSFTNKSHLVDKQLLLAWDRPRLLRMINKRAVASKLVFDFLRPRIPELAVGANKIENLDLGVQEKIFYQIFARQAYPGKREAALLEWMLTRIVDAQGIPFPRELITFANLAREQQLKMDDPQNTPLISGQAVREAFPLVSEIRCKTYLAEFPDLEHHFDRFSGLDKATISREKLIELMHGIEPSGDEIIKRLYEVGVLQVADGTHISVAKQLEVPRLYRTGLGLVLKGRL